MFRSPAAIFISLALFSGSSAMGLPQTQLPMMAQMTQTFAVGDRVEIERQGTWRTGQILDQQNLNGTTVYRVRYLDVGFVEADVPASRLRKVTSTVTQPREAQEAFDLSKPVYVERDGA